MAMRHPTIAPNSLPIAGFVVATLPSAITSPFSSSTQYRLDRSPKSIPMVRFFVRAATLPFIFAVLIFSTAGLLSAHLLCASHGERIASRWRPVFSSHLLSDFSRGLLSPLILSTFGRFLWRAHSWFSGRDLLRSS